MTDRIWIDRADQLPPVLDSLRAPGTIGLDTEFLREKTFFPKLCVLQLSTLTHVWCVDTLDAALLRDLTPVLTDGAKTKIVHAARQDLEAYFCTTQAIIAPIFDTQIAAALTGMKPQVGYAELAQTILGVNVEKNQTRTDWSRRPLSAAQLAYAADDVRYLHALMERLSERLSALGREEWAREDCAQLTQAELYEVRAERAGARIKGVAQLAPAATSVAFAVAAWRENVARTRDLPRGWILSDGAVLQLAQTGAARRAAALPELLQVELQPAEAAGLTEALIERTGIAASDVPALIGHADRMPTPEEKKLIAALGQAVDARAKALDIASEILAPRAEIKAIALGRRDSQSLRGWRRAEIGERLLAMSER